MEKGCKTAAYCSLGCKVNQYDTDAMRKLMEAHGYVTVPFSDVADVYVINTCSVTHVSDRKSRQMISRAHAQNSDAVIIAAGCYAKTNPQAVSSLPGVNIILGTNDRASIVSVVEEYVKSKRSEVKVCKTDDTVFEDLTADESEKTRAYLKIQDGCNRFCSYCIIPYARGPVRSRRIEDVCEEVKRIVSTGIKEVVITGIHISSYGKDLPGKPRLIELLEKVNDMDGVERIRLGSLEPLIIDDEFVSRIKVLSKVCNHYHLSLQSGCDATLERMNRRYRTEEFREIVKRLRDNISEVAHTTDVIVGFPGETDEEFNQTYNFLNEIKFSKMHVFKYSQRRGTKAEKFPNQVDGKVKEERSNALIEMSNKNEEEFAKQYLGKEVEVLFEREHDGHTTNYLEVESEESHTPNEISKVKVKKVENGKLLV